MSKLIHLNVLDQSPMRFGGSASHALRESVSLAQKAEALGYHRYWLTEHHNSNSFAGTSPELLIGQIAANTSSIRVGSGGVMLPNYSALKVAEQFRVLEAFYPGRIDLGIGRARGADPTAAKALVHPQPVADTEPFSQRVVDLLAFLNGSLEETHPFARVEAQPGLSSAKDPVASIEVWLLGSSRSSGLVAAELGLPFSFAEFLQGDSSVGPAAVAEYREKFRPLSSLSEPKVSVALEMICAPDEQEARHLSLSRTFDAVAEVYGLHGLVPPDKVATFTMSNEVREYYDAAANRCIACTPPQAKEVIESVARRYDTTEIFILTNCYAFEHRVRSYELVAAAMSDVE